MTGVHPLATVVERRGTYGQVTVVEVECPLAKHRHTVGVTDGTAVLWCTYGAGLYTVRVSVPPEGDTSGGDATSTT